ncbi:hypothetical protein A0J61_11470 [Choanephora cucurbitarum]|uniref:Uncharacterized protein n=1 Tax=Choanephora cucurbitarum TaxID=101091 RepID=A0A1C7MUE9_9FUNG|nr:hypothetical protein A0J61_11470 [Choanephora cucurbitarum]
MFEHQFAQFMLVEAFSLKEEESYVRSVEAYLKVCEDAADVLNEDYKAIFYHFLDDQPCGRVRCFVDPEDAKVARDIFLAKDEIVTTQDGCYQQ